MPKIEEMWAYIAEDAGPEDEGVAAFLGPSGWVPLVGADRERMLSLREQASIIATASGKPLTLVRFTNREEVDRIAPTGS